MSCASSSACVGRVSCTTRMKLSSTKLPCTPSSGEPDLVGVQISTNGCVGGDGPGAIAMRLFQLYFGPHNAPPGARGTHYTFPAGSDDVCLAPSPGATRPRVPAVSSVNAHHLATRQTGCHTRSTVPQLDLSFKRRGSCCGQWPNYMDKYVRTGTSAL